MADFGVDFRVIVTDHMDELMQALKQAGFATLIHAAPHIVRFAREQLGKETDRRRRGMDEVTALVFQQFAEELKAALEYRHAAGWDSGLEIGINPDRLRLAQLTLETRLANRELQLKPYIRGAVAALVNLVPELIHDAIPHVIAAATREIGRNVRVLGTFH